MWLSFWELWKYKDLLTKWKAMQKELQNLVIRAKEWKYVDEEWIEQSWAVVIDFTWDMKVRDLSINDKSLLNESNKEKLEKLLLDTIQKWLAKVQEVSTEKSKSILGDVDLWSIKDMLWSM